MDFKTFHDRVPCGVCDKYNSKGKFLCAACLDRAVDSMAAVQDFARQILFLREYEPRPLSESFRGDVCFVGRNQETVYAHRFVMAGKSPVLRRMLDTDMTEKESGVVRIDDASTPVLRAIVNYCYTAGIRFTEEAPAEEVLKFAHRYDIKDLKAVCERELSGSINAENVCERAKLACIYDAEKLDSEIAKFFQENFSEVYPRFVERLFKNSL